MIPLALGVTILDVHTRLAYLETNASLNAAIGTAAVCRHNVLCFTPLAWMTASPNDKHHHHHLLGGLALNSNDK